MYEFLHALQPSHAINMIDLNDCAVNGQAARDDVDVRMSRSDACAIPVNTLNDVFDNEHVADGMLGCLPRDHVSRSLNLN